MGSWLGCCKWSGPSVAVKKRLQEFGDCRGPRLGCIPITTSAITNRYSKGGPLLNSDSPLQDSHVEDAQFKGLAKESYPRISPISPTNLSAL